MNKNNDYTELSALLDGEAAHPEALRRDAAADPECAQRLATYEMMGDALRSLPDPRVAEDFTDRVLAATRETPRRASPNVIRWAGVACILALAAAGLYYYPRADAPAFVANTPALAPETLAWTVDEPAWEDEAWPEMDTVQLARVMADLTPEDSAGDADLFEVMDMMDTVDETVLQGLLRAWAKES